MFKETPAGELIEANRHARPFCSNQLLNDVILIHFADNAIHICYAEKFTPVIYTCKHSAATNNKASEQNAVFAQSDCECDIQLVEIGLHLYDIRRSGSQD